MLVSWSDGTEQHWCESDVTFGDGRWGLPIPKPHPIYMVVGRPVKVESAVSPDDPNFKEAVDKLHEKVIEELTRIYNEHKDEFGWKDRPLEIV